MEHDGACRWLPVLIVVLLRRMVSSHSLTKGAPSGSTSSEVLATRRLTLWLVGVDVFEACADKEGCRQRPAAPSLRMVGAVRCLYLMLFSCGA